MRNKGQIDMFGLVIIVFLLVVIALFSLFFISRGGAEDRNDVYYSLKAHNFANALAKASVEDTNMEALVLSCCSGASGSCEKALNFAEREFARLGYSDDNIAKKKVRFELECYSGYSGYRGECEEGVTSESIILQSQDLIRVILCRE
jgi:uncharacterized protein (UPF0333 family)